jgi:CPA2 family monovalent cation:H+ antiporter-2/glutathione-regulated potassium-efflux system protein KefB
MSRNPTDAHGCAGLADGAGNAGGDRGADFGGALSHPPLFRLIGNLGEREMFVVAALFTVMAAAAVMEVLGLSTALGALSRA